MSRVSETIISMIDKGQNILDIAKYFGGVSELLGVTKKYPYLQAMVMTKLGGQLHCSAEDENGDMVPFTLNFIINELDNVDVDDIDEHYDAFVDVIIPELEVWGALQLLFTWIENYLMDLGAEVGSYNDEKLNKKPIWVYVKTINGKTYYYNDDSVSDETILKIIPDKYKGD